jgi:hypothetical protein
MLGGETNFFEEMCSEKGGGSAPKEKRKQERKGKQLNEADNLKPSRKPWAFD